MFHHLDVSIIIVNYNVKFFLEQCLYSVERACSSVSAEIFVIDNNSSDGSREYLEPLFPNVQFIWNKENKGFGKANNQVLQQCKGNYVLFLNPDVILPEHFFNKCFTFLSEHPDAGALGVKMIDGSGVYLKESKRGFPSPKNSFFKLSGLSALFPHSAFFSGYYFAALRPDRPGKVDVLAGACMMLSKEAAGATGGFDESFFMYGEDIDLSYRIQQAGFQNYYFPGTGIIHFKGESTKKLSREYVRHFYGAMSLFARKHYQKNKIVYALMLLFIFKGALLASMKMYIQNLASKIFVKRGRDSASLQSFVWADESCFNKVLRLSSHASFPVVLSGRVSVDDNDQAYTIGKINDIADQAGDAKMTGLICCSGNVSNTEIISFMEANPGRFEYFIHACGSGSIVGSSDKNSRGVVMAKP